MEIDTTDAHMGPVRTRAFLRHFRTNAHKYNAPPPPRLPRAFMTAAPTRAPWCSFWPLEMDRGLAEAVERDEDALRLTDLQLNQGVQLGRPHA